ncbi:MAG: hypothetical protein A2Z38_09710 [Planctomycetes bacterium RBG_19FT_COMBO_48_8]|nr:MAG: hypothetical protein A2Z38_09710 [Planctomycetes bacterium RBG_19FT_COMBO_48_8]
MKPIRQIEKIVGRAQARAGRVTDARILTDAVNALTNSTINRPRALRPGPTIWRFIMESKVTRYSAAAVVALAAALVLLGPFGTSKNGSIVWAEVVEKVRQMRTVIHKEKYVFWEIGQEEPGLEADVLDAIKYASEEYGVFEDVSNDKGLLAQVYFLKETQQFIIVSPTEKKYIKVSIPGDIFWRITGIVTPRGLVEYFTSGHYKELGRAKFDNFNVEGFETTDPNILFPIPEPLRSMFPVNDIVGRIWVDVETSLPVGIEAEFNTGRGLLTGLKKLHGEWRAYDFQWNAEIPEGIFEPNIPDDYTEFKVTDFIPPEAKAGLVGLVAIPAGFVFWKKRRRKRAKANQ